LTSVAGIVLSKPERRWSRVVVEGASRVPLVKRLFSDAYDHYFDDARGGQVRLFRGIFPNFSSAAEALPATRAVGYDNAASAYRVIDEWLTISEYDYPIMFWLSKLLPECRLLFDWGGNVGLKYFAYQKYLSYPEQMRWRVCDVPAVVAAGEQVAERERAGALDFTTVLDTMAESDILLAAGSLHFIEDPFAELQKLPALPKHLLLCKVPAHDQPSAVTLHNMGTSICLYHLFNRREFVAKVAALGYELIDSWVSSDCSCHIPFHPKYSVRAYSGFYFRKRAPIEGTRRPPC
jgi:putative methyltransferase (TIGR04325 family)